MTRIINYIKQLFCKHIFEFDETDYKSTNMLGGERTGKRVSVLCKKCTYHKSFWKF